MQNPHPLRAAGLAAVLILAACNRQPQTVAVGPEDDMKADLAKAAPVELPPAMTASKSLRCKDNSVVYVDFFAGNKTAMFRTEKGGTPTRLTAAADGEPLTAEGGYSVTGNDKSANVTVAQPGKPAQSCKG